MYAMIMQRFTFLFLIRTSVSTNPGFLIIFVFWREKNLGVKVGFGFVIFCTHSPRLISKTRFPHSISVAVTLYGRAE